MLEMFLRLYNGHEVHHYNVRRYCVVNMTMGIKFKPFDIINMQFSAYIYLYTHTHTHTHTQSLITI